MLCLSNGSDKGHLGCVRELVAAKVDVNRAGSTQAVPLVRALLADNVPGARLLLEAAGARTDVRDAKGRPINLLKRRLGRLRYATIYYQCSNSGP